MVVVVAISRRPETADRVREPVVPHIRTMGRAERPTMDVDQAIGAVVVAAVRVVLARLRAG
jgi:hypothetical protein